jgi:hypothetical protein
MASGIQIDGEKLAALWRESLLPQELFAAKMGLGRSGLGRLLRPGVQGVHGRRLVQLAASLGISVKDLQKRLAPDSGTAAAPPTESAVSRLLGGQPALISDLEAAAKEEGITLPELFQRISREWLEGHRAPKVAHTQLDGLKPRTQSASRSTEAKPSRAEPGPGPRPARRAGQNGR